MPSARLKSRQSQSPSPLILSLSSRSRRHNARIKNIKHKTERHHRDRKTTARHINVQHNTHVATNTNKSSNIVVKNKAAAAAAAAAASGQRKVQNHTEQMNINGDHEVVDLCSPVVVNSDVASAIVTTNNRQPQLSFTTATTTTTSTIRNQTSYKSRTLTSNSGRHSILPAFPASIENDRPDLLLANVPDYLLTKEELERRYSFQFRPSFLVMGDPPANIPSFFWPFYQQLFLDLVEHLHLDMSIIDYNYARLSKCLDIWTKERMIRFNYKRHEVVLDLKEYAIALEFFLQIDVDLFYMKTCSFRDVQPQEPNQFLFCTTDPEARHEMIDCGNCGLCYPKYDKKKRGGGQPSVKFGLASRQHQFISKYKTILNCPCSCQTCNIIYVLTCPCGKFDYVGESGATLADRMIAHRYHGNRIMHEAFLGQENMKLAHPNYVKSNEILSKDDMHLYRHSIECQSAIQMFLDENPRYWRFVPMTNEEADQAEENIVIATMDFKSTDIKDDEKIKLFIKNLPPPPPGYRFSMRQYYLQYAYFKSRRHESIPNEHLDLYNAKVIAVLPETGSKVLRQIVEALFITHAQTKLNSSGRLVHDDNNNNNNNNNNNHDHHENVVWCEGLVRRPLSSFVSVAAATTATTMETTAVQSN